MKEEQVTYSKDDMLKLINTAGTNLVMKKRKVSIEGHIRKLTEERDYTLELVTRYRKRAGELDPELRKAEESARESRELFTLLKAQRDAQKNELDRLREIAKKESLLQQKTSAVKTLREAVSAIQEQHARLQQAYALKQKQKGELEGNKNSVISALKGLKEKLDSLPTVREQIIKRIAGFDFAGYLETIRTEASALDSRFSGPLQLSLEDELAFLPGILQCSLKVENLYRLVSEANPDQQEGLTPEVGVLKGFNKARDTELLANIRKGLNKHLADLAAHARKELYGLEERKRVSETKIQTTEEELKRLKSDLQNAVETLNSEREFRERSKEQLKGLENQLAAQKIELEQMKKKAEMVQLTIDFNKLFAQSLGPSKEYLNTINRRQNASLEEYKRSFDSVARVLRENKK